MGTLKQMDELERIARDILRNGKAERAQKQVNLKMAFQNLEVSDDRLEA